MLVQQTREIPSSTAFREHGTQNMVRRKAKRACESICLFTLKIGREAVIAMQTSVAQAAEVKPHRIVFSPCSPLFDEERSSHEVNQ